MTAEAKKLNPDSGSQETSVGWVEYIVEKDLVFPVLLGVVHLGIPLFYFFSQHILLCCLIVAVVMSLNKRGGENHG